MITEERMHMNGSVGGEDIAAELGSILASRPFRNSNQCSGLLRYIVEHTLAGEENLLRERVIGAELFGRPADYETSEDPVVRLRVSEVRKRLAQYYLSDRSQRNVQIEIPPGSYRATFHWNTAVPEGAKAPALSGVTEQKEHLEASAEANPVSSPELLLPPQSSEIQPSRRPRFRPIPRRSRTQILVGVLVFCAVLVAGGLAFLHFNSGDRAFRTFWAPWVNGPKPVIVSVGSNAVYRFKFEYLDHYADEHGLKNSGQEFYVPLPKGQTVAADNLYPAYQSFVALGDVASVSRVVQTLTEQRKPYQERFPNDVSFAELRENPSVLVGGFNNPMTLELTKQLEFVMRGGNEIIDQSDPKRRWQLGQSAPDTADYAIITRLVQRNGDAPMISIAGLGQYGTLAAAELICSPTGIRMVTDQLPKDWANKNFQVVLRVSIVDFKASASEVAASKSW